MVEGAKSWLKDNATLVYFLIGQGILVVGAGFSLTTYMVNLENRVATLEIRGSPHLSEINNRLTVLESKTTDNKQRLDHVIDIMTKELHISPSNK